MILLEKDLYAGANSQHAIGLFAVDSEWNRLRGDSLTRQEAYRQFIERQNHLVDPYKDLRPIKGLYAAGPEVSNMVAPTYPDFFSGHTFGFASYSERHAVINAVNEMK